MKANDLHINLIEGYFGLLKNLNTDTKLELIAMLSNSMKSSKNKKNVSLRSLYGALISNQTADEIISDIKKSRTFTRKREEL